MSLHDVESIIKFIRGRTSMIPDIGIVCGSGLGHLTENYVEKSLTLNYEDIPGFPEATVVGHTGELVFGTLASKSVVCMRGRFHPYEGYSPQKCVIGIRVMAALGVKMIIVTNAAGGVNPNFNIGDVMIINDQISFVGLGGNNPLNGPNFSHFGPRFPSMSNAFPKDLRDFTRKVASELKDAPNLQEGCYIGVAGPSYETPSEISVLRLLGGETVGMSTVHEIVAANHSGLKVLGLSLVTNRCLGRGETGLAPSHQEVIDSINSVQNQVQHLVRAVVDQVDISSFPQSPAYFHYAGLPQAKL